MKKISILNFVPFLICVPSVLMGAAIMHMNQVPMTVYLQNILVLIIGSFLAMIYISRGIKLSVKTVFVLILLGILALCAAFLFPGMEGVHRWIKIGPMNINLAFIVLPLLLIGLNVLLEMGKLGFSYICILVIAALLFLQPDASMITAFSAAILWLMFHNNKKKLLPCILAIVLIGLSAVSWLNLDSLAPVSYVEDILLLAKESGTIYLIFSLLFIVITLCPFWWKAAQPHKTLSIGLGVFFIIVNLSTFLGNFPVPLMGYGVSPIIGYLIAVSWVMQKKQNGALSS